MKRTEQQTIDINDSLIRYAHAKMFAAIYDEGFALGNKHHTESLVIRDTNWTPYQNRDKNFVGKDPMARYKDMIYCAGVRDGIAAYRLTMDETFAEMKKRSGKQGFMI